MMWTIWVMSGLLPSLGLPVPQLSLPVYPQDCSQLLRVDKILVPVEVIKPITLKAKNLPQPQPGQRGWPSASSTSRQRAEGARLRFNSSSVQCQNTRECPAHWPLCPPRPASLSWPVSSAGQDCPQHQQNCSAPPTGFANLAGPSQAHHAFACRCNPCCGDPRGWGLQLWAC